VPAGLRNHAIDGPVLVSWANEGVFATDVTSSEVYAWQSVVM
jgi:hypothetical protein